MLCDGNVLCGHKSTIIPIATHTHTQSGFYREQKRIWFETIGLMRFHLSRKMTRTEIECTLCLTLYVYDECVHTICMAFVWIQLHSLYDNHHEFICVLIEWINLSVFSTINNNNSVGLAMKLNISFGHQIKMWNVSDVTTKQLSIKWNQHLPHVLPCSNEIRIFVIKMHITFSIQ